MWGSTSAEKNVSSIKWNRDWCFCSTPKEINGGYREVLVPSQAKPKLPEPCKFKWNDSGMHNCSRRQGKGRHEG